MSRSKDIDEGNSEQMQTVDPAQAIDQTPSASQEQASDAEQAQAVRQESDSNSSGAKKPAAGQINFFASVKLTIISLALIATTVLIGAWCPQEAQGGKEKVIETFGQPMADNLIRWGISDIFHSPWFLFLIALLTVNMVACSFQRVFPKIRSLKTKMPPLKGQAIGKLPYTRSVEVESSATDAIAKLATILKKRGFVVEVHDGKLTAEYGKYGRLAATITHIGLLTLLAGVTVTSWTGFSGFQAVRPGESMSFITSEHSKLWIGKLPTWEVRVDGTTRENYPGGEPKQWYSDLAVVDERGKVQAQQKISVNNPLSYGGVDVYQSSWGLDEVHVAFNGSEKHLPLQPMGKRYASFLPLEVDKNGAPQSILIFSVMDQSSPMRIFAKRVDWQGPRLIKEVKIGESANLGMVRVTFLRVLPVTGLQYKCDPGIPIVYTAFGFIMLGVLLAIVPHRHVWASVERRVESGAACPDSNEENNDLKEPYFLHVGGKSYKAKVGFERMMDKALASGFGLVPPPQATDEKTPSAAKEEQESKCPISK